MKLVDTLKTIRKHHDTSVGICGNHAGYVLDTTNSIAAYEDMVAKFRVCLRNAYDGWEHFSGNELFPIKDEEYSSSEKAYTVRRVKGISVWEGEYGRRRYELLDRMIKIAKELNQ